MACTAGIRTLVVVRRGAIGGGAHDDAAVMWLALPEEDGVGGPVDAAAGMARAAAWLRASPVACVPSISSTLVCTIHSGDVDRCSCT